MNAFTQQAATPKTDSADHRPMTGKMLCAWISLWSGVFFLVSGAVFSVWVFRDPYGLMLKHEREIYESRDEYKAAFDAGVDKEAMDVRSLLGDFFGGIVGTCANVAATLIVVAAFLMQSAELQQQIKEAKETNETHKQSKEVAEYQNAISRFLSMKKEVAVQVNVMGRDWGVCLTDCRRLVAKAERYLDRSDMVVKDRGDVYMSLNEQLFELESHLDDLECLRRLMSLSEAMLDTEAIDGATRRLMLEVIESDVGFDPTKAVANLNVVKSKMLVVLDGFSPDGSMI